jgi:hypothetical protein
MNNAPTPEVQEAVAHRLREHQWTDERGWGPGVASKDVDTAVGPRRALVLWQRWPERWHLSGEYWSEGNNALATVSVVLDARTTVSDAIVSVDRFVIAAECAIDATYARRLCL